MEARSRCCILYPVSSMSLLRTIGNSLRLRVLISVLLGFMALAVPAFFGFNWVVNSTVVQLGTLFAEKQVLYDRHRGLGALIREVSLAETLSGSQAIRDWAADEDNAERKRRGIAELEHYRRYFADRSYFFIVAGSGNYYFNNSANSFAGDQLRYTVSRENPDDAWYYSTIELAQGCHLNVNNDANLGVTKVWMNCVIREGGRVLGVLGTGIDLTAFIQEVVNVPQRGVTAMFVDRQGMIQAHRDETLVSLANFEDRIDSKRTVFSLASGEGDTATLRHLMESVTSSDTLAQSDFITVNGKRTLVGVGYLDKLGWYNVTFMDIDTVIDRQLFVPVGLLLAVIMVLVAVVLMLVFKRQVLDRIVGLERVVHQARSGDYRAALAITPGGSDEICRLTAALTQMAASVDDHTRELERRVRERTLDLERLAYRDAQTGLLNRRGFAAFHAEASAEGPFGLMLVDIDAFKSVNDTHGHAAGDAVIAEIAGRVEALLPQGAAAARWGGDEFIVLVPRCTSAGLRQLAQQVQQAAISRAISISSDRSVSVSVSLGAALGERHDALEVANDMADAALYTAKQAGRDRVVVFDRDMRPVPRRRQSVA